MKILTIDGNNLVHRVYWVANNMASKSENMHVYMFLNSVKSYVEMYKHGIPTNSSNQYFAVAQA